MNLLQDIIAKESLKMLEHSLSFSPTRQHFEKAEQAWKALSVWRKIKSKKKYIYKKAWEIYKQEQTSAPADFKNTITIRKPQRYQGVTND